MNEKTERDLLRAESDLLKETDTELGELAGDIVEGIAYAETGGPRPRRRRRPGAPRRPSGRGRPGRGRSRAPERDPGPSDRGPDAHRRGGSRGRGKPPTKGRPSGRGPGGRRKGPDPRDHSDDRRPPE